MVKFKTLWVGLRIILNLIISCRIKVFGSLVAGPGWNASMRGAAVIVEISSKVNVEGPKQRCNQDYPLC